MSSLSLSEPALQALQRSSGRVLLGYSGGLDSSVLLHLLSADAGLRPRLQALHVHHGLSASAGDWAAHCQQQCAAYGIPCEVERVSVNRRGDGLEQAAREARYAAFARHLQPGDTLVLAHHADDQAETFFMRLLRGAGLHGLAGMASERWLSQDVRLLRPLLHWRRAQLEAYAAAQSLRWVEDESNQDEQLARNWWRQHLLPQIYARFPGHEAALQRSLQQLQQDQHMLQSLLQPLIAAVCVDWPWPDAQPLALDLQALQTQPAAYAPYLLRGWLARCGLMVPSAGWLQQVQQQAQAVADAQPQLALGEWQLHRHRHWLYLQRPARMPDACPLPLQQEGGQPWAGGTLTVSRARGGVRAGHYQLQAAVSVRHMRIQAPGRPHKTLKALFQEAGVPASLRDVWPVLTQDGQLVAVCGLAVAEPFSCDDGLRPGWTV